MKTNKLKLETDLENCKNTDADLVIAQQEIKECTDELDATMKKSLHCQSENISNLKMIVDLKVNQTKLVSNLESLKSTDADLVVSQQEIKKCNEELDAETMRNLQCESGKKICEKSLEKITRKTEELEEEILELKANKLKLESDLENCKSDLVISQQETKNCTEELEAETKRNLQCECDKKTCFEKLEDEAEKNKNLQAQNDESEIKSEGLEETIGEFKTNQTKLVRDLERFKISNADLVKSQQKTNKCDENLDNEKNRRLQCQSENVLNLKTILELKRNQTKLESNLESFNFQCESAKKTCGEELKNEVKKNQNLQEQKSKFFKLLEDSRSLSKTDQIEACNHNASCSKSGKF